MTTTTTIQPLRQLESLVGRREEIQAEADDIQYQLDLAAARFHDTGERADPVWFANANHALRCRRREIQRLDRQIKTEKRRADAVLSAPSPDATARYIAKQERLRELAQCFIDAAEETLPRRTFEGLMERARELHAVANDLD